MFIAIDVNYSGIKFFITDKSLADCIVFNVAITPEKSNDQYISEIIDIISTRIAIKQNTFLYVVMISDIQKFNAIITSIFEKHLKVVPLIINTKNIPLHIASEHSIPTATIAMSYMLTKKYKYNDFILFDFDDIISFSTIIDNKFIGYTLYPGINVLSSTLYQRYKFFPDVVYTPTEQCLSNDQYQALSCGLFHGCIGACDNIMNTIIDSFQRNFTVIGTGSYIEDIIKYSKRVNILDTTLKVESIVEIAKKNILTA